MNSKIIMGIVEIFLGTIIFGFSTFLGATSPEGMIITILALIYWRLPISDGVRT